MAKTKVKDKKFEKMKIVFDRLGNTVDVWFDNPKKEVFSSEVGDGLILKKDKDGRVIGFEKLNYLPAKKKFEKPVEFVVR